MSLSLIGHTNTRAPRVGDIVCDDGRLLYKMGTITHGVYNDSGIMIDCHVRFSRMLHQWYPTTDLQWDEQLQLYRSRSDR